MAESLTTISFENCSSGDFDLVLNKLPALTSVKIYIIRGLINKNQLTPNNKIKVFKCCDFNDILRVVLAYFTGLEVLIVVKVNKEDFKCWDHWMGKKVNINVIEKFYDQLIANDGTINMTIYIIIIE
jgi:hypothetical protein